MQGMAVEVIQSDVLRTVAHGFLGRKGGVSTGIYAGLNVGLGSEDARESVIQNRLLGVQSVLPGDTGACPSVSFCRCCAGRQCHFAR